MRRSSSQKSILLIGLGDYVRILEIGELTDKKFDNKAWINAVNVTGETPLHIAARRRILELFESMLPYYNDIEACDDQGNTVLHRLVDSNVESDEEHKRKRIDLLRIVISKGADVNKRNKHGSTPAHLAAKHCHVEILEILKEGGADFSLCNNDGETSLLLACKHMFKFRGTEEEAIIIDFLVNCNCDVNAVDEEGYSALHYAVELCSSRTVVKLLESEADVNILTKEYKLTPLHLAAKRKKPTKVDILIKAGATVNSEDIDGLTPLHLALLESTPEVVESLIECGSDLNHTEAILQFTPVHVAVYQQLGDLLQLMLDKGADINGSNAGGLTPLHLSSMMGDVESTKILIDHGANVNCRDENESTPLHLAIRKNHDLNRDVYGIVGAAAVIYGKEKSSIAKLLTCKYYPMDEDYEAVIRLLISNGADVNVVTKHGESLLSLAVKFNIANVVKILLENEANVNYKQPDSEFTALHLAAYNNYKDVAEILINGAADINALTKDGKNSLHLAIESKSVEMLSLLVEHGVNLNCVESLSGFTPLQLALNVNFIEGSEILINKGADGDSTQDDNSPMSLESSEPDVVDIL